MTSETEQLRISEIRLKNFRAFTSCRLRLDDLTVLVGRNGSGKTSLLEAMDFIRECLSTPLVSAIERRGGLQGVRRRTAGKPPDLSVAVVLTYGKKRTPVLYGFRLGHRSVKGSYLVTVKEEILVGNSRIPSFHRRTATTVISDEVSVSPDIDPQSLLFPIIARKDKRWQTISRALRGMRVYSLAPFIIREEPQIGTDRYLKRDGSNLGDILKSLEDDPRSLDWILAHLDRITSGIVSIRTEASSTGRRIIVFRQTSGAAIPNEFSSGSMSDGTLRALGILVALKQSQPLSLVCIDEVEDSVHPAAMGVLIDAISTISQDTQVLFTSHSPEALSHPEITGDAVRIVDWSEGVSHVFELSKEVRSMLTPPHTVGKLLRSNSLWTADHPSTLSDSIFDV